MPELAIAVFAAAIGEVNAAAAELAAGVLVEPEVRSLEAAPKMAAKSYCAPAGLPELTLVVWAGALACVCAAVRRTPEAALASFPANAVRLCVLVIMQA